MTNIIKDTLQAKLDSIHANLEELTSTKNLMIADRAKQLLEIPDALEVKVNHGDTITIYLEGKDILSINQRTYGNPYLNTYSTMMDTEFEFKRLMFNGKIAEKFLNDSGMFLKLFDTFEDLQKQINSLRTEGFALKSEITKIALAEAAALQKAKRDKFQAGEPIEFEKLETISYGRGRWDSIQRVKRFRLIESSKSGKTVTIEFECQKYDSDEVVKYVKENMKMTYLDYYL